MGPKAQSELRDAQVVMTLTWLPLLLFSLTATCQAVFYQGGVGDLLNKRGNFIIHSSANGKPRYTSLVRRNFLRFGKRSGTFPPLPSSLEGERGGEEEDGEKLPFEEEGEEQEHFEGEQEPFSRFPAHYVIEEDAQPAKRARNFIRFGRAAHLRFDGREGEQMKAVRERRVGGTRRRMSNFLRFGRNPSCKSSPCFLLS